MPWVDQSQTRVPERTYIWICALCLSNHRSIDLLTAEDLARTFKTRVQAIGIVLPLLAPWDNPVYVTRAWCLYELYQTLKLGLKKCTVNIDILLPPSQLALLQLRGCQYTRIRGDRPGSRSDPGGERHREPAVRPPGHREIISNIPGGFPLLNVTVQKSLRKWFTRHGAVDTASRWALFPTMMNLNIDGTTLPTTFGSNSSGIGSSGSSGINADRSGSSTGHRTWQQRRSSGWIDCPSAASVAGHSKGRGYAPEGVAVDSPQRGSLGRPRRRRGDQSARRRRPP